jgi:hypothetical protein
MPRRAELTMVLTLVILPALIVACTAPVRSDDDDRTKAPAMPCDFQHDFVMGGYSARISDTDGSARGSIPDLAKIGLNWIGPTYSLPSSVIGITEREESEATGLCMVHSLFATRTVEDPAAPNYHGPVGTAIDVADVNAAGNDEVADADQQQLDVWADQIAGQVREVVADPVLDARTGAWYLTAEELRYWKPAERRLLELASQAVAREDPQHRPFFSYQPGHADADRLGQLLDVQDAVEVGAYPNYSGADHQRIIVRYVMEQMTSAAVGNSDKKILPALEMFESRDNPLAPGDRERLPTLTMHDAMVAVANGASGFLIWSFGMRGGFVSYDEYFDAWANTVRTIRATGLDKVVESGVVRPEITATVTGGPASLELHLPDPVYPRTVLPAVSIRAWTLDGMVYVLVVNSAEDPVTVTLNNLPAGPLTNLLTGLPAGEIASTTLPPLGAMLVSTPG